MPAQTPAMSARAVGAGLLLEVRPLPMAAALFTVLLGVGCAQGDLRNVPPSVLPLVGSVSFGLYTAHLMDTYVDVVLRGDATPAAYPWYFRDSSGLVAPARYPPLVAGSAALCVLFAALASSVGGPAVALLLGAALALALTYAPFLDRFLLGVSLGYPLGCAGVLFASFLSVGGVLSAPFLVLVAAIVVALAGTKIRSDVIDLAEDRRVDKRTVAVALGEKRALQVGYGLALSGLAAAALIPLAFPVSLALSVPPLAGAAAVVWTAKREPLAASFAMALALLAMLGAYVTILAALPRAVAA